LKGNKGGENRKGVEPVGTEMEQQ
jgi:predicted small metal-binding protein